MDIEQAHIYIVDDDQSFGMSLKRLLNAKGIAADFFPSARSFLKSAYLSDKKGIAILDVQMPDCDGFALMARMKDMDCCMPVIVITGHANSNTRSLALKNGAIGYLEKPFNEQLLQDIIKQYIS